MNTVKVLLVMEVDFDVEFRRAKNQKILYSSSIDVRHPIPPFIYLENNRIQFSESALEVKGINIGDRLEIMYEQEAYHTEPVLVNRTALNQVGGNVLRKNGTVSLRGDANKQLSKYGMIFEVLTFDPVNGYYPLRMIDYDSQKGIIGCVGDSVPDITTADSIDSEDPSNVLPELTEEDYEFADETEDNEKTGYAVDYDDSEDSNEQEDKENDDFDAILNSILN